MKKYVILVLLAGMSCQFSRLAAQPTPFDTRSSRLFEDGQAFFETKNYAAATRYLEDCLKADDASLSDGQTCRARYCIAMSAFYRRSDDAALKLEEYQRDYPYATGAEMVYLYRGILEYEAGKYKQAIKYFNAIHEENLSLEQKQELYFYKGYSCIRQENYKNAAYELDKLLQTPYCRFTDAGHYYYGYAEYQLKNYTAAAGHLERVKEHEDFSATAPYVLCQCYYAMDDCDRVAATGKPLLRDAKNKNRAEILRLMASCAFRSKDYKTTLEYYGEYRKTNPKLTREDWYQTGMASYFTERHDDAVEALSKCTGGKDKLAQSAYFHTALSYLAQGDRKNARMAFQQAASSDYDMAVKEDALYDYALVTYELSYSPFNESVSAFERFLKEFPDSRYVPNVYEYLTNVYLTTRNYAEAYQSIRNINTNTPSVKAAEQRILFGLATTSIANRNYGAAQQYLETMLAGRSYDASLTARAHYWLGECRYRAGKYSDAKTEYGTYLRKTTNRGEQEYPLAHYALGYTCIRLQEYPDANIWFRKYANLEKENKVMLLDAFNRIADCYFADRQYELADKAYKQAYAQGADLAGADYALYRQGLIAGLQKNYAAKAETMTLLAERYPKSEWADEARLETAKAYVAMNRGDDAIQTYRSIAATSPKSSAVTRKARLQIAMLQYNSGQTDEALASYKQVVSDYPNTAEAQAALGAIEDILVEQNRVDQYAAIAQSMGATATDREDSLMYKAAEKVYFKERYDEAAASLGKYMDKYPSGKYHSLAAYYQANCHYRLGDYDAALRRYRELVQDAGNPNLEFSLVRASAICYDKGLYEEAAGYFAQLARTGTQDNRRNAETGLMRCHYNLKRYPETLRDAEGALQRYASYPELVTEARYKMMKSYEAMGDADSAFVCMAPLAADTRTEEGAEAKYLTAAYYHSKGQNDLAEKEIFDFIEKGTPHGHWLAKSFVLLSDLYAERGQYFEAKQYLLSLRDNYGRTDLEINAAIADRLAVIEKHESETISNEE